MVRRDISRLEGFSDAVFGFVLTLLVVSLEVPESSADLRGILLGFPAFAATFALVCWARHTAPSATTREDSDRRSEGCTPPPPRAAVPA